MNRNDLYNSLNEIDDDILERSESASETKKKPTLRRWGALAACFCLFIVSAAVVPGLLPGSTPTPPNISEPPVQSNPNQSEGKENSEDPWNPCQVTFNSVSTVMDTARIYIPGHFTEELSREEIAALEPGMKTGFMQYSGHAGFDGEGNLVRVYLVVTTTIPENNISIAISQSDAVHDYVMDDEPVISVCEDVEYKVYQWNSANDSITLAADASINGYTYDFTLKTSMQNLEQAKEDFLLVLECFAYYADGKPDLSAIVADEIPGWLDNTLSHEESLRDSAYGAYMLKSVPSGFSEESIRRYNDQTSDYLSGLWTSGYDEIRWKVYTISDADEIRLTSVADTKNYDLSLYPIPRASSVPEDLREIVDNPIFSADELTMEALRARAYKTGETGDSTGWRMEFSVKYGDVVVEVRSKGVDPEWVYQQLMNLIAE